MVFQPWSKIQVMCYIGATAFKCSDTTGYLFYDINLSSPLWIFFKPSQVEQSSLFFMLPTTLPSVYFYYYSHYILPSVHIIFLSVSLDLLPSRQRKTMTLFLNLQCLVKSLMDSKCSINVSYINKKVKWSYLDYQKFSIF